jgi:hypothetical protein
MVAPGGPTCARCGAPLRWVGEWYAWACDRCQVTYPAPGQQQPQPQPQPQAQAWAQAQPAVAGGSKKMIVIGGVIVVAAGGVGLALALTLGRHGAKAGTATADALVTQAIEDATHGDAAALARLAGAPGPVADLVSCTDKDAAAEYAKQVAKVPEEARAATEAWTRMIDVGIVSIKPAGDPIPMKQGAALRAGCVVTTDASVQQLDVVVSYMGSDHAKHEGTRQFTATQIDGRWYLPDMPKAFTDEPTAAVEAPPAPAPEKPSGQGPGSAEEIAKAAAAAAARGDVDAMVALTGPEFFPALLDCPASMEADYGKMLDQIREDDDKAARAWKGTGLTIVTMTPNDRTTREPGQDMAGCKVKVHFELDVCDLLLSYQQGGETQSLIAHITVGKIGDRWYLLDFPAPP